MEKQTLTHIIGEGFVVDRGLVLSPNPDDYPPHIHDAWEVLFLLRGNVSYKVEGKKYQLKRGNLVLTRPSVFHQIQPTHESTYERYNIIIDPRIIPRAIKDRLPCADVFSCREEHRIFDLFERFDDYSQENDKELLLRLCDNIIEEILYNLTIIAPMAKNDMASNPLVNKALAYIDEHLAGISGIDEICENLYITKSHLHHLFSKELGVSPKQYITSKRLMLAQKLIRHGKKATEAAVEVGYEDYATFFRNYKKQFGFSPSEQLSTLTERLILA
ncbi:MAG: helix-turn-helix transcriptional regulator [Clostridia bacterium]|nr:helix-turn-helix transcriptional regulator [Clostridia bacterium]